MSAVGQGKGSEDRAKGRGEHQEPTNASRLGRPLPEGHVGKGGARKQLGLEKTLALWLLDSLPVPGHPWFRSWPDLFSS